MSNKRKALSPGYEGRLRLREHAFKLLKEGFAPPVVQTDLVLKYGVELDAARHAVNIVIGSMQRLEVPLGDCG